MSYNKEIYSVIRIRSWCYKTQSNECKTGKMTLELNLEGLLEIRMRISEEVNGRKLVGNSYSGVISHDN